MQSTSLRRGHLPINGLDLFYKVHGALGTSKTPPLLLIPGAFMATESMTSWINAFADRRAVIVFDQQGHGSTPDTTRDVIRAVRRRCRSTTARPGVERAAVRGYSRAAGSHCN